MAIMGMHSVINNMKHLYCILLWVVLWDMVLSQTKEDKQSQSCIGHKTFVSCGLSSEEKSVVRVKEVLYGQSPTCGQTPRHCVVGDGSFHPCTGVQSCVFDTPSRDIQYCGASNYLKIKYECLKESLLSNICSEERRTTVARGYLVTPGYPSRVSLVPDRRCVTTIVQPRGWTIRVYLLDYGSLPSTAPDACEQEVTFRDILPRKKGGYLPQVSVCLSGKLGRDKLLYESASSVMQIAFFTTKNGITAEKMGAMFYFEGLGPGMKPSLVTNPPPPLPKPLPTLPTVPVTLPPTTTPAPTRAPPPPSLPPSVTPGYRPPYRPAPPPVIPAYPPDPMLVLPGPDIDLSGFSPKFARRTTLPPTFHISNTTVPYYQSGIDVYYATDNLTYFDDLVEGDYEYEGGSNDKWASIVGGTMFALAMMMLVGILLIMIVEKRKARKRQEAAASKPGPHGSLPHLESQARPAPVQKLHGLSHLERAKMEKRNLYKMHRAHSNNGFSSDGEKYEGLYRKGRYWDKATETDTSSIEGDIRHQVYEEYTNLSESTTDPMPTDSNGNIPTARPDKNYDVTARPDKSYEVTSAGRKVGFHVEKETGKKNRRVTSSHTYETAAAVMSNSAEDLRNNNNTVSSNRDVVTSNRDTVTPNTDAVTSNRDTVTSNRDTVTSNRETNNNQANLRTCGSSDSLTTVSNIDGSSSIYCSNNSMFASNASLGSLWEARSRASTRDSTRDKASRHSAGDKISSMISKFEGEKSARDNQYETAKAYWRSKGTSKAWGKDGGREGGKEPPGTLPKPGLVKSSPIIKVKQSPTQRVRASPATKPRSSPTTRSSPKPRASPSQRTIDTSLVHKRPSPRSSPAKSRTSSRSRSPHSTKSGSSPRSGGRKLPDEHAPGEFHSQEPELSSYSIYYSRSDFKRSLPKFNAGPPKRPVVRPPPPPCHPPPKPTTQKPCLKPKPGIKRSDPVSRSTEDIFKSKKDLTKAKKSKKNAASKLNYIYDGGASLGGSYRSLNSLDTLDQQNGQGTCQSTGQGAGTGSAAINGHYESVSNGMSLKSDDDLEIVDNELYPHTDFDT